MLSATERHPPLTNPIYKDRKLFSFAKQIIASSGLLWAMVFYLPTLRSHFMPLKDCFAFSITALVVAYTEIMQWVGMKEGKDRGLDRGQVMVHTCFHISFLFCTLV